MLLRRFASAAAAAAASAAASAPRRRRALGAVAAAAAVLVSRLSLLALANVAADAFNGTLPAVDHHAQFSARAFSTARSFSSALSAPGAMSQLRGVREVVTSILTREGAGFPVYRPFPNRKCDQVDPFLLLDHMFADWAPREAKGAPDHPHRGFETVTYMIEGEFQHKDSQRNSGKIRAGDVQWMTAGSGVVHSEMPSTEFWERGGRINGFQLWVNLPAKDKMIPPRYQEVPNAKIPRAFTDDQLVEARVIAGQCLGVSAVIDTHTPIAFVHLIVKPGGRLVQPVPRDHNAFLYAFGEPDGPGVLHTNGGTVLRHAQMASFAHDGDAIEVSCPADAPEGLSALLIAGAPINEPIARYGPFVMNTQQQIHDAFMDFQLGRLGEINH